MLESFFKRADSTVVPSWEADHEKWHALFVQTGEEDRVKERLQYKFGNAGLRILVPKRKLNERKNGMWDTRIRTLFPGYVLLKGCVGAKEYYQMKGVPGVIKLLTDERGPQIIHPDEMKIVNRLVGDGEIIEVSRVFYEGGRITVIDGPLLGMEGLIKAVDRRKGRVKVHMSLAGEARLVDLSVAMVQTA